MPPEVLQTAKPMSNVRTNYVYNLINTVAGLLFPLVTFPYAARVLMPEGVGQVDFYVSIINYIVLFTGLGIPLYGIREIARVKDDAVKTARTATEILILHCSLILLGYLAVAVLCLSVPEIRENAPVFLILSIQLIFTALGCEWFYQGIEEFRYITVRNVAVKAVALVCLFLLVRSRDDLIQYAVFTVIGTVGNNIFNFIRLRKYIGRAAWRTVGQRREAAGRSSETEAGQCSEAVAERSGETEAGPSSEAAAGQSSETEAGQSSEAAAGLSSILKSLNVARHLKPALKIFSLNIVTGIYVQLGTVMLGFMTSAAVVAYYTSATKLTKMLTGILTALGTVMIPKMSHLYATGNSEEFNRLCTKSLSFINFLSLPMATGLAILAPSVIYLFCGPAYEAAGLTLRIIAPMIICVGISNVIGVQILYPQGKEKLILISNIAGASVNLVLNFILIPLYGHNGAAISIVAAEFSVALTQVIIARKYIPVKIISRKYLNYYIGTVLMAAVCLGLNSLELSLMLRIILIPLAGILTYGLWLLLRKDSLAMDILKLLQPARTEQR